MSDRLRESDVVKVRREFRHGDDTGAMKVDQVVGEGDTAFVALRAADGTLRKWYRAATELEKAR